MNWEARDEFVEKMFRRSGSACSGRYHAFGVDNFREFCEGAGIGEVDGKVKFYCEMDDNRDLCPHTALAAAFHPQVRLGTS